MIDNLRDRIAWLMWCANEGYLTDVDRAGVSNIFTADPATLHPDDAFSLPSWRGMADAVIAELLPDRLEKLMTDNLRDRIAAVLTRHDCFGIDDTVECLCEVTFDPDAVARNEPVWELHVADALIRELGLQREERSGIWCSTGLTEPQHRYVTEWTTDE